MPYLRGMKTSASQARRLPTPMVVTTTSAPDSRSRRSSDPATVMSASRAATIRRLSPSATASACGSMSTSARLHGCPVRIRSATSPWVNMALPAPMRTILRRVMLSLSIFYDRNNSESTPCNNR